MNHKIGLRASRPTPTAYTIQMTCISESDFPFLHGIEAESTFQEAKCQMHLSMRAGIHAKLPDIVHIKVRARFFQEYQPKFALFPIVLAA